MNVEDAVRVVRAHPDYRILERFSPVNSYNRMDGISKPLKVGAYVDSETTGVDTRKDNIIELAIVKFMYDEDGRIYLVGTGDSFLNDPGIPLDEKIRSVTGISDEDVKGQMIDARNVDDLLSDVELVIAHNAGFDRRICERYFPRFTELPWACAQNDIPWRREFGSPGLSLEVIAAFVGGIFYNAHRALIDCQIGVHMLTAEDRDKNPALLYAINAASEDSLRVWACNSPFHTKDLLKERGYHWNDGKDGRPKAWHRNMGQDHTGVQEEITWLRTNVGAYPEVTSTTALDRYSIRER